MPSKSSGESIFECVSQFDDYIRLTSAGVILHNEVERLHAVYEGRPSARSLFDRPTSPDAFAAFLSDPAQHVTQACRRTFRNLLPNSLQVRQTVEDLSPDKKYAVIHGIRNVKSNDYIDPCPRNIYTANEDVLWAVENTFLNVQMLVTPGVNPPQQDPKRATGFGALLRSIEYDYEVLREHEKISPRVMEMTACVGRILDVINNNRSIFERAFRAAVKINSTELAKT